MTLTLTLDGVIWHTIVYHSSTSICIPNFVQTGKLCEQTDRRMDTETGFIGWTRSNTYQIDRHKTWQSL